jgi:hypothetical protein
VSRDTKHVKRHTSTALFPPGCGSFCLVLLLCMAHGPACTTAAVHRHLHCFSDGALFPWPSPCWPWLVFALEVPMPSGLFSAWACAGSGPRRLQLAAWPQAQIPAMIRPRARCSGRSARRSQVWGSGLVSSRGRIPQGACGPRPATELPTHVTTGTCGFFFTYALVCRCIREPMWHSTQAHKTTANMTRGVRKQVACSFLPANTTMRDKHDDIMTSMIVIDTSEKSEYCIHGITC